MQVLILVTHLLGTGHLSRALTLGHAFADQGHTVNLLSGGMPAQHLQTGDVNFHQLPPLRSDGTNFTTLLTPENTVADEAYLTSRNHAILGLFHAQEPDIVITELFPFGRRVLRAEFLALAGAAKKCAKPCTVLSSIRDILAPPSKPEKATKTDQIIDTFYDGVLVHSDPTTTPLEQSWPVSEALYQKLHYTGYVAPTPAKPHPQNIGAGEIIVSAGGGSVGKALFECAIETAQLNTDQKWRLLIGGANPSAEVGRLKNLANRVNITIEPARSDFRQLLNHAACSVSMCGYNTALDVLQAGTPSVFIPFDDGGEVEQTLRATSLAKHPSFAVVSSKVLSPETMLEAVKKVKAAGSFQSNTLKFNGAQNTVSIATKLAQPK
jgi:predicted glycosyltransferase